MASTLDGTGNLETNNHAMTICSPLQRAKNLTRRTMLPALPHTKRALNFGKEIINCLGERDSKVTCTSRPIPASGIRKRQRMAASGLTSRAGQCPPKENSFARRVPNEMGCAPAATQSAARSREQRGIPRLSALSLCGTSPARGAGEPDQTVAGPFAELDGPLRRAITARRGLSSRMVRKCWLGI